MAGSITGDLKEQGAAVLVMVGLAIISVLGMIVLGIFNDVSNSLGLVANINTTVTTAITAFIAGFALVGTFATITMLVIVTKAIIGVVRNLR